MSLPSLAALTSLTSLLALAASGCGSYSFGSTPTPVFSSSSTSARGIGANAEMEQTGTRIRVRASHVCDVVRREERTAGHQAEAYHPLQRLMVQQDAEDQAASHLGPLTEGILRGDDDSAMQNRTLSTELRRSMNPWILGAGAAGLLETALKANARIDGRVSGERQQAGGTHHNVRCQGDAPYAGVDVALAFHDEVVELGHTDAEGKLTVDLADALAHRDDLGEPDVAAAVLVAGNPAGDAHLGPVLRVIAARRAAAAAHAPVDGTTVARGPEY